MDAQLIPINEWCEGETCEGIEFVSQILITSDGEVLQYCDECGEQALEQDRNKS